MQPCLSPSLGGAALDVHARMAMASDSDSDARNGGGSESGSKTPSASPSVTRTPTAASPGSVAGVYSSGRRRARVASLICSGGWIGAMRKKQASDFNPSPSTGDENNSIAKKSTG
ncbi:unnamed protein product [Urochloa humidicola]